MSADNRDIKAVLKKNVKTLSQNTKRVALIIGNANYLHVQKLRNPVNDAIDINDALKSLGFETFFTCNANHEQMETKISLFTNELQEGVVGLFYFAGHGIQVKGENYLLPVCANVQTENQVKHKLISLNYVLGEMEAAKNNLNIVILDACRNNPFLDGSRSISISRGLAEVGKIKGTIIMYATAAGDVAADGQERNGLYTKHLLNYIKTPGISALDMMTLVTDGVEQETNGKQSPWTSFSIREHFYFTPTQDSENQKDINKMQAKMTSLEKENKTLKDSVNTNTLVDRSLKKKKPKDVFIERFGEVENMEKLLENFAVINSLEDIAKHYVKIASWQHKIKQGFDYTEALERIEQEKKVIEMCFKDIEEVIDE